MQHLQQQPHPRITPNLLRQPRSRHTIILAHRRDRLHPEPAKQPHQNSHKLDLVDGRSGREGVGSYLS